MQKFEKYAEMVAEVTRAINAAVTPYGLHTYSPLAVYAVLDAIASPLKSLAPNGPLAWDVCDKGLQTYYASRLAAAVERLKSPSSLVVNPMMDAIVVALARHEKPMPVHLLFRNTLRAFLARPRLTCAGIPAALRANSSLDPAFKSACGYLVNGHVIALSEDGKAWRLSI